MSDLLANARMVVLLVPLAILAWALLQTRTARRCLRLLLWLAGGLAIAIAIALVPVAWSGILAGRPLEALLVAFLLFTPCWRCCHGDVRGHRDPGIRAMPMAPAAEVALAAGPRIGYASHADYVAYRQAHGLPYTPQDAGWPDGWITEPAEAYGA